MSTRREAREWAFQILFQLDMNPTEEKHPADVFKDFWEGQLRLRTGENADRLPPAPIRTFTEQLVTGVMHNREAIDARITACLKNWDINRIGRVERNVLRLGVFEIAFAEKKPPLPVVINEAIDISKFFGTRESGRFINGILDAVARKQQAVAETDAAREWSPGS